MIGEMGKEERKITSFTLHNIYYRTQGAEAEKPIYLLRNQHSAMVSLVATL
jgi:hypothetical protein